MSLPAPLVIWRRTALGDVAHEDRDLRLEELARVGMPIGSGMRDEARPRGMIVTLCSGRRPAAAPRRRHGRTHGRRVTLMVGHGERLALGAHQHLVARLIEIGSVTVCRPLRTAYARPAGFASSAPENPGVPRAIWRRATSTPTATLRAWMERACSRPFVGRADGHLAIEAARPQQRRSNVGRLVAAITTMPCWAREAVHLDQQLVQRLLALSWLREPPRLGTDASSCR